MDAMRDDLEKYEAAKAQARAPKGYYIHLALFIAVMAVLTAADYSEGGSWWVQWPLIGWGLGLFAHACLVFLPDATPASDWSQHKIEEMAAKI